MPPDRVTFPMIVCLSVAQIRIYCARVTPVLSFGERGKNGPNDLVRIWSHAFRLKI